MKKTGFTLIELLAVIVILAIIALIAVPVIMNIISSARKSAFEDTAYGLISAGEMYYTRELLNNGMTVDMEFTITDGKFVGENKLEVKGDLPKNGKIIVTKEGKVIVAVNNGTMCAKKRVDDTKVKLEETIGYCTVEPTLKELARINDFATSIDACATNGACEPGTKFAIEVAPGDIKNFYVVSDENNEVTLIMDRNIGETVAWITKSDYLSAGGTEAEWDADYGDSGNNNKGPITALNYLEVQTVGWTNIPAFNYTYVDENTTKKYEDIIKIGIRARMLTITEAIGVGCTGYYKAGSATCPEWLYGNLAAPPYGFWLSSAYAGYAVNAWGVSMYGSVSYNGVYYGGDFGVRPVIEIQK